MEARKTIQRIEKIMRYYSLSSGEFSLKTDISESTIDVLIKSDHMVTLTIVRKICKAFPHVNARWLLVGEGDFFIETTKEIIADNEIKINIIVDEFNLILEIKREDKEFYHAAGKYLNEKINVYKLEHSNTDIQKTLKRVAFYFAVEFIKNKHNENLNKSEECKNMHIYRQAALKFRAMFNFFCKKYPEYEYRKLYAMLAYQYTVNYIRSITD